MENEYRRGNYHTKIKDLLEQSRKNKIRLIVGGIDIMLKLYVKLRY